MRLKVNDVISDSDTFNEKMLTEENYQNHRSYNEQLLLINCYNFNFSLPVFEEYRKNWAAVGGVNLILAPITFVLNLTVLIAFCKINGKNSILQITSIICSKGNMPLLLKTACRS